MWAFFKGASTETDTEIERAGVSVFESASVSGP